jgi:flagellar protein FliS
MWDNVASKMYLANKVLTATTEQLQLMLYEGAIRYALIARKELESRNFEAAQAAFERMDAFFCELQTGLRPELAPDLCDRIAALYNFCQRKCHEAHLHHAIEPLDDAIKILQHLRQTWVMVLDKLTEERAAAQHVEPVLPALEPSPAPAGP